MERIREFVEALRQGPRRPGARRGERASFVHPRALPWPPETVAPPPQVWLLVLLFFLGGMVPTSVAAPGRFDVFDVFVGYDGIVPEGSWFPVVCDIENKGPGFNAIFEITSNQQSQTRQMPLELPTGTHKRFVIPVFGSGRYNLNWNARLLDEKGRVRAEAQVRQVRRQNLWQVPVFGALSRTMGGRPVLPDINQNRAELKLEVARMLPDVFPDNPIALEGLDGLYLNSEMAMEDRLRVPQVNALLAWLYRGGHLIVAVEQPGQVNGTEWLRRLLPCDVAGMTTVPAHAELQDWLRSSQRVDGRQYSFVQPASAPSVPAASGRRTPVRAINPAAANSTPVPNPFTELPADATFEAAPLEVAAVTVRDGEVLIGQPNTPLVITARRGRGQVTVLTFSPERDPFLSWRNRSYFWAKLANVPAELLTPNASFRFASHSVDGVFGAMIDSKQVRKLPVGWLMLLLVGYLAVIGPLDRWWLKRLGKQMLTWITFPAYVVFFSLLIYFIGYKLRAGESEWNELHVVDVIPMGEQADLRGRTFASVYSPANARYPLSSELPYAALRGEFLGNYGGGQESSRASITQRGNNFVAEIFVPVWTSQLYVNDWLNRVPTPLTFSVERQGDKLRVVVNNKLDRKLTNARLVVDGQVLELGDLVAHDSTTLNLSKSGRSLASFVHDNGQMFVSAVQQRNQAFGENRTQIVNVPLSAMAASFVPYLPDQPNSGYSFVAPPGFDLSPLVERGDAVLLAWAGDYAPVKGFNQFTPRRSHRDTLWRVTAPVK